MPNIAKVLQMAALNRTSRELVKKVTPVVAIKETEKATERAAKPRPTSKSLKRLRARLGVTQAQFGKLLGVSGQAVVQWASKEGRIRMRKTTLSALGGIQNIGNCSSSFPTLRPLLRTGLALSSGSASPPCRKLRSHDHRRKARRQPP